MIEPLNRFQRDSTLFQFTNKRLRDFIDPNHLLIRIDQWVDFSKLVEPLKENYCPDNGRPAIHPEVMVRALLISALYDITSFRRLCLAISENIAFRWFCFLTIDAEVFDHSSVTHFIERIGREGFAALFRGFNEELLRLGLLSPKMYADSSLVKANVSTNGLAPSGKTVEEFKERAIKENDLFVLRDSRENDSGPSSRYFQDAKGRLPLSLVDLDARWRTHRYPRRHGLFYQDNAVVDEGGFILARMVNHASEGEWRVTRQLLDELPLAPQSLAADTAYNSGEFRQELANRGITAHVPIHPNQKANMVSRAGFSYRGDHLVCPQGKRLPRQAHLRKDQTYQYVARQSDCQACIVKDRCLPPRQKRRYVALSEYYEVHLQARRQNASVTFKEEMRKRQTVVEGVFASLDRLGWASCKLRSIWKVDCEGFLAALAHNVLKLVRRLTLKMMSPSLACQ